jgi:hypothetical protein
MKYKLLALMLVAGGSLFAETHFAIGVNIGTPGYYIPPPPPVAYEVRPPCPGPGYTWIEGYWYPADGRYLWHAGYWALPPYPGGYWVAPRYYGGRFVAGYWAGGRGWDHDWDHDGYRGFGRPGWGHEGWGFREREHDHGHGWGRFGHR